MHIDSHNHQPYYFAFLLLNRGLVVIFYFAINHISYVCTIIKMNCVYLEQSVDYLAFSKELVLRKLTLCTRKKNECHFNTF